ncbi:MAG: polysaccharide deacetylase family protein [Firmicutes bacterium]|nr:polysaccharide deacetylase family protein [Bacillota bacterium]
MSKRTALIANVVIASILLSLSVVVFTTDLNSVFLTVSAPMQNGNRERQSVSFMVAVNGQTPHLAPLIDILDERGVGATFFLSGSWIGANLALTRRLCRDFEVGNMAFSGTDIRRKSESAQRQEIADTHSFLQSAACHPTRLFFPPNSSFNRNTLRAAESLGYITVLPSVTDLASINFRSGDLILLKPDMVTLHALPSLIDHFLATGYSIIPVSEAIV